MIEEMFAALRANAGLIAFAADSLGVTYQAVYQRVKDTPEFEAIKIEARRKVTEMAIGGLVAEVKAKKPWAIRYWLDRMGKEEGFSVRVEAPGGGMVQVTQAVVINVQYIEAPGTDAANGDDALTTSYTIKTEKAG